MDTAGIEPAPPRCLIIRKPGYVTTAPYVHWKYMAGNNYHTSDLDTTRCEYKGYLQAKPTRCRYTLPTQTHSTSILVEATPRANFISKTLVLRVAHGSRIQDPLGAIGIDISPRPVQLAAVMAADNLLKHAPALVFG